MELTQEEKRILVEFTGLKVREFTHENITHLCVHKEEGISPNLPDFFKYNMPKILLECMNKLMSNGDWWMNISDSQNGFIEVFRPKTQMDDHMDFDLRDYNNDFNLTLARAYLYAIKEMR